MPSGTGSERTLTDMLVARLQFIIDLPGWLLLLLADGPLGMAMGFDMFHRRLPAVVADVVEVLGLVFAVFLFLAWMLVVGIECNRMVPEKLRSSTSLFGFCVFVAAGGVVLAGTGSLIGYGHARVAVFPVGLAVLYIMRFTAHSLVTAEKQAEMESGESFEAMVTFSLWGLTIFYLQPRVQKLLGREVDEGGLGV